MLFRSTTFSGSGASLTSIPNSALSNSTISGVSLGANLNTLTLNTSGTGLSGSTTYNGSSGTTFTVTSNATNSNTASTIVARDGSGNFSAGTITAALSGTASNATGVSGYGSVGVNVIAGNWPGAAYWGMGSYDTSTVHRLRIDQVASNNYGLAWAGATDVSLYLGASALVLTSSNYSSYSAFTGQITGSSLSVTGIATATDFNSTSDINLKTNIQPILSPLSKLLQLNGITFNWKKDNRPSVGVIAQDVEKVFPELVNENDEFKTVNYDGLIGLLIEAIKEQQKEIEELKKHINK